MLFFARLVRRHSQLYCVRVTAVETCGRSYPARLTPFNAMTNKISSTTGNEPPEPPYGEKLVAIGKDIESINKNIEAINGRLDDVVTWRVLNKILVVVAILGGSLVTGYTVWVVPSQIKSRLDERFDKFQEKLQEDRRSERADINASISAIGDSLKPLITTQTVVSALEDKTEGNSEELRRKLPEVKNVLNTARKNNVPVPRQKIQNIGLNLLREKYKDSKVNQDPVLREEVWETVTTLASQTTFENRPLPDRVIEEATAKSIIFEGGRFQLNIHTAREGAVFKECTVIYSGENVDFKNIYFIDCKFEIDKGVAGEQFLTAVLKSNDSAIDFQFPARPKPTPEQEKPRES